MSLTATARSAGDTLRQEVLVDGRHRLVTDEPAQLGGTDTGPAPHELVPAALAACVAVTIRMYARTKGWALGELSVDVVYDNTSTPRHFDVTVNLPRDLTRAGPSPDAGRRGLPVRRSIEAGMVFDEHLPREARAPRRLSERAVSRRACPARPRRARADA